MAKRATRNGTGSTSSTASWTTRNVEPKRVAAPARARSGPRRNAASAAVAVGDRHAAVAAEGLARDPHPDRRLAALPLGDVDHPGDPPHELGIVPALDEVLDGEVVLYVRLDDRVEDLVGRQVLVVPLAR